MDAQELTPEYVLQPHAISRASYRLSATARKLIAMGMSILPFDLSNLTVTFSVMECCKALGLDPSGKTYVLLKEAVRECIKTEITLEKGNEGRDWEMFTWISHAKCEQNAVTLEFSHGLADYLRELRKMYARLDLVDLGRLQSLYAIRFFEMGKSYESLAGRQGNKPGCWFFERAIGDLRKIMGVEDKKYKLTRDFRRFVIEAPLAELNASNLGFKMTAVYVRRGKFIEGVRFDCQKVERKMPNRNKKAAPCLPAPEKIPLDDRSLEEKRLEHVKKLYPDEYAEIYEEVLARPTNNFLKDNPRYWEAQASRIACSKLISLHGIRK